MFNELNISPLLIDNIGKNKDSNTLKHQQVSMLKKNNCWVAR